MKHRTSAFAGVSRSLYARISAAYLISLILLCSGAAWFALSQAADFGRELEQRLNLHLAETLAMTLEPALDGGAATAAARTAAKQIVEINPSLSLYLLDSDGRVLAAYDERRCGIGATVATTPLKAMLGGNPMLPILGTAPCSGQDTVFSVARIHYDHGRSGFLYVLLNGEPYASLLTMLRTSYVMRGVVTAGVLATLLTGAVGLAAFALLTRRFRTLTRAVERFAAGDHWQRVLSTGDDEIGRLAQAFNDMAATIQAQLNALRETDRLRRELVANVSHDFRSPLTSLRGYAEQLLHAEPAGDGEHRQRLQAIISNADRLTRLAEQLSVLARLDTYEQPLRIERFALPELMQDVLIKFRPQAERAGVRLLQRCDPQLPPIAADLGLIDRALSNLLDNALAAVDRGGEVTLEADRIGDSIRVCVRDDGHGIAADELQLVTQRFYRTRRSRTDLQGGSGLGLSIVREILERHGSRLRIDSQVGHGTLVWFTLRPA